MNTLYHNKNTVSGRVWLLFLEVWSIVRAFVASIMVVLLFLAMWLAMPNVVEAGITSVVSNVTPGWSNSRKRVVFNNGSYFFLLYTDGNGNIKYASSADNFTWPTSGTLLSDQKTTEAAFDIYLVNDAKFDLAYHTSADETLARTCTISGATITAGNPILKESTPSACEEKRIGPEGMSKVKV